jgi:tetratricopeptide (TPR) repeat protein
MFNSSKRGAGRFILVAMTVAAMCATGPVLAIDGGGGGNSGGYSSDGGGGGSSGPTLDDARNLIERGRFKDAIGVLRHVVEAEPRNADALNLLGFSLRKSGDMRNAQGFYLKALKIRPNHRGANEYLGELYVEIGQIEKAQQQLQALEAICGTSCREYRELKKYIDAAI